MPSAGYRDHANAAAVYQAEMRDARVAAFGVWAEVRRPVGDTVYDEYGDYDPTVERETVTLPLIPLYGEMAQLRDLLSLEDEAGAVGLDALVRAADDWARDSLVTLPLRAADAEEGETRVWRVASVGVGHLERGYRRTVRLVPERPDADA